MIYTFLMFFGEISGGLFFYLNQKSYFKKKFSIKITSKFEHSFITNNALIKRIDSNIKILFLFVMTPLFDFCPPDTVFLSPTGRTIKKKLVPLKIWGTIGGQM